MFDGIKTAFLTAGTTILEKTIEHAPVVCFVGGAIAFGATIYLAVKASPKVKEDLEKHKMKAEELDERLKATENGGSNEDIEDGESVEPLTRKEYNSEIRSLYVDTTINVVKHMGAAAACGVLSLSLFGLGCYIPCARFVKLSGEYMALDKGFKEYRAVVREEEGVEKDRHYMFKTREVTKTTKVPSLDEEGELSETEVSEDIKVGDENPLFWTYSVETTPIFSSSEVMNDAILEEKRKNIERKLNKTHLITDNDVLSELCLFNVIKQNPLFGVRFGKKWKKDGDNTFKFDIEKIWVPDYTKRDGYSLKYQISYDREVLC